MITYNKIDENTVEVTDTQTVVSKTTISLSELMFDKDSLLRTIEANNQENEIANQEITGMIAVIDKKILDFKNLGVKETVEKGLSKIIK